MDQDEYTKWLKSTEHERENNHLPSEIRSEVIDAINESNLRYSLVSKKW